jgi:predicted rRNA methylase YqxC with S4 and FtsJ domains
LIWALPQGALPIACFNTELPKFTRLTWGKGNWPGNYEKTHVCWSWKKTNARELTPARFSTPFAPVDLVVIDCSFISLQKILPAAVALLRNSGSILALIKPQFEAGKAEADKGKGVITDPSIHERVIATLRRYVQRTTHPALAKTHRIASPRPCG